MARKNKEKLKTFRVGYTFHSYIDVKANDEDEARDVVTNMSNKKLLEDAEFDIDYCDELEDE
jgi:DNA-dependent RNA polymerase auxiliary subunit epsilon